MGIKSWRKIIFESNVSSIEMLPKIRKKVGKKTNYI